MKNQTYKKGWAFVLSLAMVFTTLFGGFGFLGINGIVDEVYAADVWDGTTPATSVGAIFSGGDGSEASPYQIGTTADLAQLAANVNAGTTYGGICFKMTSDIVLNNGILDGSGNFTKTGDSITSAAFSWTPIGTQTKPFQGKFDGNNHTVSGIYINSASDAKGLFGWVYTGGTISNLGIKNSYIKGQMFVGGVAGYVYGGTVTNCYNEGTIVSSGNYAGGVTGLLLSVSTMTDCYNSGSIQSIGQNVGGVSGGCGVVSDMMRCYNLGTVESEKGHVGGVVGEVYNSGKIIGCYNQGSVTSTGTEQGVGGVVGFCNFITMENCYNTGAVVASSAQAVGGIAGYIYPGSMTNCYNAASVQGATSVGGIAGYIYYSSSVSYCYYNIDSYTGSMVGVVDSGTVGATSTSKSAIDMKSAAFVTLLNDQARYLNPANFSHFYWFSDTGSVNSGYPVLDTAYLVNFNNNSGTTEASPRYALATPGGIVTLPTTNPTRTGGYTFGGWYTNSSGGTEFTSATAVNADQTVYAHWLSSTASLTSLTLSSGTLSPSFASGTVSYSANVSSAVSSITVKPFGPYYSTFMVSGSAVTNNTYSPSIPLSVGGNTITIVVTSQDTTVTKTYTVTVTRATPTYTIASIGNQTMAGLTAGYGAGTQETKTLTITRTGTGDLASLATTLGGINASSFTITQPLATTLNSGTTSTAFTVQAKHGLAVGTYTATVTVSAVGMTDKSFLVTQVVSAAHKPVTSISGVPTSGTTGTEIDLTTATVNPSDATNKTIVWSVKNAGTTGITTANLATGKFTPATAGALELTATIANGATASSNFTQDVMITIAPTYKAVTSITGAPTSGTTGTEIDLTTATVNPSDATNKTIVWSVKNAGTTGMATANLATGKFTPATAGALELTATIANGATVSTDYTQDVMITIAQAYKAVTSITGAPTTGTTGTEIDLTSATVNPSDATNKTIVWSVKNAGTTGITTANLATGKFTPATAGALELTATIANGATASSDYTQDFTITVNTPGTDIYTISADTTPFNFGSLTVGYGSAPAAQTVTITNTGNQTITLTEPATTNASSNYNISSLSAVTLDASETATFTVQPKTGLAVGTYNETININGHNGSNSAATSISVQFSVTSAGDGSNGGGGGNSPKASPIIETNTGSVNGNQLKIAADAAKERGTVTIKSEETSEVTLPTSGFDSLSGKNNSLTVVTENGTLTFNSKAVAAMGTQAEAADIKVIVDDVVKTTLTEEQQTKVGDKTIYDLSVMSGGKLISSFNGGKVNVSIPYELKTGETAENLTVWYMADDGSLTEINCTYDAKNKAVTFVVDHFSKYIIGYEGLADWVNPFTDVKSSAWYYDAAAFVNANGLMKGQTDTAFAPQTAMTRGMFVTILGRMESIDATLYASKNTFSDVKNNEYYASYIAWASEKGIVTGMGGDKFAPNASVTREQMAVMMTNYLKFKGQGPAGSWAIQLTYGDLDKVSSWADEAVMFMTAKDLMNGMGNDAKGNPFFAPKATSTRAQTAQVMMSLGELVK